MIDQIKKIFKKNYQSINRIEIDIKRLCNNFSYLQSLQKNAILFPVLKSNAYGHGLQGIAKMIDKLDTPIVAVDSFIEYQYIKKYSHKRVLVLSEMFKENYNFFDFKRSSFCIYNFSTLEFLVNLRKKIKIHIFLNT
jgi:alanine racemase